MSPINHLDTDLSLKIKMKQISVRMFLICYDCDYIKLHESEWIDLKVVIPSITFKNKGKKTVK